MEYVRDLIPSVDRGHKIHYEKMIDLADIEKRERDAIRAHRIQILVSKRRKTDMGGYGWTFTASTSEAAQSYFNFQFDNSKYRLARASFF